MEYEPQNPIATYTDKYGEEKIIHRPKGSGLREFKGTGTPALRINRSVAVLMGQKIKALRIDRGMTLEELGIASHIASATPKQYIWGIENGTRKEGVRLGTLLLLANALEVSVSDLLPDLSDAIQHSGLSVESKSVLRAQ